MIEPTRKRRRKPKPLRFADLRVGAILIHHRKTLNAYHRPHPLPIANDEPREVQYVPAIVTSYAIVTDRWFDPVYGERDESAGQMVGLRYWAKEPIGSKWSYTLLGLARAGWHYATADQIEDQDRQLAREDRVRRAVRDGEASPIRRVS